MNKAYYDNYFKYYLEVEYTFIWGEFYECNGGHVWHLSDIEEEWENMAS